jgi:hypothetical protein
MRFVIALLGLQAPCAAAFMLQRQQKIAMRMSFLTHLARNFVG